jgi:hypothetical protein
MFCTLVPMMGSFSAMRIDSFELKGKWVSLPVVGIFEIRGDGRLRLGAILRS